MCCQFHVLCPPLPLFPPPSPFYTFWDIIYITLILYTYSLIAIHLSCQLVAVIYPSAVTPLIHLPLSTRQYQYSRQQCLLQRIMWNSRWLFQCDSACINAGCNHEWPIAAHKISVKKKSNPATFIVKRLNYNFSDVIVLFRPSRYSFFFLLLTGS